MLKLRLRKLKVWKIMLWSDKFNKVYIIFCIVNNVLKFIDFKALIVERI